MNERASFRLNILLSGVEEMKRIVIHEMRSRGIFSTSGTSIGVFCKMSHILPSLYRVFLCFFVIFLVAEYRIQNTLALAFS